MVDSIKITALQDIGANIAYTTLVPVVNMAGTPTTQKANLQNLGNLILNGAGGSYFARAAQANLALSVANAAQPNITSVGTLTSLAVTGNITAGNVNGGNIVVANFYYGDGGFLTNVASGSNYSNSNVANYLPTFTGTVGANRISSNALSGSNVEISANGAVFLFGQGGALYWPTPGGQQKVIETNIDNEFEIKSTTNVVISTDISNSNSHFTFDSDGIFTAPSNVNLLGSRLNVGPDAANVTALLNPTLVIANSGAQYVQASIINTDATGSSDWAADGADGGDDEAWADLGFAGHSFNDANYTITAPGDGYLFVQAYANGLGGNMVLATGDHSNTADIIFATGGFLANAEFARIDHANDVFHLTRAGSGIKFADGSIQTTAAGAGGLPLANGNSIIDIATVDGNITLDSNGNVFTFGTDGNLTTPSNLVIGPNGAGGSSIYQFGAPLQVLGEGANSALIVGWTANSSGPEDVVAMAFNNPLGNGASNLVIGVGNNSTTVNYWNFDNTGALTLPGSGYIVNPVNSSLDPLNPNVSTMIFTPDSGYSSQSLVLDPTAPGHIHLRAPGANIDEPYANIFLGGEDSSFEVGYYTGSAPNVFIHSGGNTWEFINDGSTIYPTLTVTRGDRTGTLTGQTILFGDSTQEAILTTPNGTSDINSSQRLVINPGAGYANTTGEGGDIYLYAGRGGDAGGSGGDIKIRGGLGPVDGNGGYLDIQGGEADGNGSGGYIDILGGQSANSTGGYVSVTGGQGISGASANLTGGVGTAGPGGGVNIAGGVSSNGVPEYGNVTITSGASTWTFDNTGVLTVPGEGIINSIDDTVTLRSSNTASGNSNGVYLGTSGGLGFFDTATPGNWLEIFRNGSDPQLGTIGNLKILTDSTNTAQSWTFGANGNLTLPGNLVFNANVYTSAGFTLSTLPDIGGQVDYSNRTMGYSADNNGTASLYARDAAGLGNNNAVVTANGTNGTVLIRAANAALSNRDWTFDGSGNLTLPGNTVAINFANGSAAFGNIATINLNGNTSQVLLGNGAFAAIPSSSIIANGNSNVSIASSNGNVVINAVGNTTMTVTGTGANVTGTLTSTGKIGYASGSTVTQTTNRGNGVTINALAGTIITTSASMVANQIDTFSVANDQVDPNNDIVLVQIVSPNFGVYNCVAQPSATISVSLTGFYVNIVNISGFTTSSDAITIRFMVIKAPNA